MEKVKIEKDPDLIIDRLYYRDGYKAIVETRWSVQSRIRLKRDIITKYYSISKCGLITAEPRYAYDFATGAFDTESIRRASLAHDIVCQAIKEGLLDIKWISEGNRLLMVIGLEDEMWRVRAWWVYKTVSKYWDMKKNPEDYLGDAHPIKMIG